MNIANFSSFDYLNKNIWAVDEIHFGEEGISIDKPSIHVRVYRCVMEFFLQFALIRRFFEWVGVECPSQANKEQVLENHLGYLGDNPDKVNPFDCQQALFQVADKEFAADKKKNIERVRGLFLERCRNAIKHSEDTIEQKCQGLAALGYDPQMMQQDVESLIIGQIDVEQDITLPFLAGLKAIPQAGEEIKGVIDKRMLALHLQQIYASEATNLEKCQDIEDLRANFPSCANEITQEIAALVAEEIEAIAKLDDGEGQCARLELLGEAEVVPQQFQDGIEVLQEQSLLKAVSQIQASDIGFEEKRERILGLKELSFVSDDFIDQVIDKLQRGYDSFEKGVRWLNALHNALSKIGNVRNPGQMRELLEGARNAAFVCANNHAQSENGPLNAGMNVHSLFTVLFELVLNASNLSHGHIGKQIIGIVQNELYLDYLAITATKGGNAPLAETVAAYPQWVKAQIQKGLQPWEDKAKDSPDDKKSAAAVRRIKDFLTNHVYENGENALIPKENTLRHLHCQGFRESVLKIGVGFLENFYREQSLYLNDDESEQLREWVDERLLEESFKSEINVSEEFVVTYQFIELKKLFPLLRDVDISVEGLISVFSTINHYLNENEICLDLLAKDKLFIDPLNPGMKDPRDFFREKIAKYIDLYTNENIKIDDIANQNEKSIINELQALMELVPPYFGMESPEFVVEMDTGGDAVLARHLARNPSGGFVGGVPPPEIGSGSAEEWEAFPSCSPIVFESVWHGSEGHKSSNEQDDNIIPVVREEFE